MVAVLVAVLGANRRRPRNGRPLCLRRERETQPDPPLIDLKVVREFQRSVVEVISEESPEVARRVVARLKERRALRASGTLPALDGGFDVA